MMYDTSIRYRKPYRQLMASWTREILDWSGEASVLVVGGFDRLDGSLLLPDDLSAFDLALPLRTPAASGGRARC